MAHNLEKLIQLPKVELHVHLEGCVNATFWHDMLQRNKAAEMPALSELENRFQMKNFFDFIQTFQAVMQAFQSPEDFYLLAKKSLQNMSAQGICYTEMMLTPFYFNTTLDHTEVVQEIDRAAKEAESEHGIQMKLLFDAPRNLGNQVVGEIFNLAAADKTGRVIGVGLGGDEANFPARDFINEFAQARANGLLAICHAGETDGEQSMLDAIELLGVSRIGHALGIEEGSRTEEVVAQYNVALDLCPTSNICTGQIKNITEHPFMDYFERGYQITINSDDPGFFKSNLLDEMSLLAQQYNLGPAELCQLSKRAVDSSFLLAGEKNKLTAKILEHFDLWSQEE